jgi:hypothetical protein
VKNKFFPFLTILLLIFSIYINPLTTFEGEIFPRLLPGSPNKNQLESNYPRYAKYI